MAWIAEAPVVVAALVSERAKGRRMLGNAHECNSWPTESLEQIARKCEALENAPSFGRYIDMLDSVTRERPKREPKSKLEESGDLEGGKGELAPVVAEVAPEIEAAVEGEYRRIPGEPAVNKPERPAKPKQSSFGLAGGKVKE